MIIRKVSSIQFRNNDGCSMRKIWYQIFLERFRNAPVWFTGHRKELPIRFEMTTFPPQYWRYCFNFQELYNLVVWSVKNDSNLPHNYSLVSFIFATMVIHCDPERMFLRYFAPSCPFPKYLLDCLTHWSSETFLQNLKNDLIKFSRLLVELEMCRLIFRFLLCRSPLEADKTFFFISIRY